MKKIQTTTIIHQPVEKVFRFMWDPETIHLWLPEPSESIPIATEKEQTVSYSFSKVRGWAGITLEYDQETIEFIPNRIYETRARETHGWLMWQSHWNYEAISEGTRITVQHDVELHSWLQLFSPIFFLMAQKKIEGDLIRLKKVMEKD